MAGVKLSGVSKVYPSGSLALYDINFEARDKEFLVILGGEKSGKSSLLRVIVGVEEPTSGIVMLGGKDATDLDPNERDVAMVFKGDSLFKGLTVFENVAFGLRRRKFPQSVVEQRVKAVSNILGLNEILYRKPKVLSAAAKQRVAIGRALVREPSVYLFDEPLSGLDENLKKDMLNLIANLQARVNGTFIYATKNLSEAMSLGTRIAVMKNGMIQQIDLPANLYDYPANAYVAFLIGSPTINFIRGARIERADEGYIASFKGGSLKISEKVLSRFAEISDYAESGKEVILGIRPEDVVLSDEGNLSGSLGKCELSGGVTYGEFLFGGAEIIITAAEGAAAGECRAKFDEDRLYIFDADTRYSLLDRDEGYKKTDYPEADVAPLAFGEEEEVLKNFNPKKEQKHKNLR